MTDQAKYPIQSVAVRKATAMEDICPECGGALDTGWECNYCGFDAFPLVRRQFGLSDSAPPAQEQKR